MQTIELKYPVESSGELYQKLSMRRSKVKDRLLVTKLKNITDAEKEIRLFANLCEVSPDVIESLDESDYINLAKTYKDFFGFEGILEELSLSSQK